jgi:hypothetical protein
VLLASEADRPIRTDQGVAEQVIKKVWGQRPGLLQEPAGVVRVTG